MGLEGRGVRTGLKEEYFRLVNVDNKEIVYPTLAINRSVVQAGKLEEKMGEPKQVLEGNKSVNRLQMTMGDWQGQQGNTWQVGVPYGPKCGRAVGGERDRCKWGRGGLGIKAGRDIFYQL